MDYYIDQTVKRVDLNQVEGKKEAARVLLPIITKIGNKIEQAHWLQKVAELLKVSEDILRESLPNSKTKTSAPVTQEEPVKATKDRSLMLCEQVLAIALKHPVNISYLVDNLSADVIVDNDLQNLYKKLIIYYTEDIGSNIEDFDYQKFYNKIKQDHLNVLADKLVLLAEKDFFDFDSDAIREELIKTINYSKRNHYSSKLKNLGDQIKQAEASGQKKEVEKMAEQFNEVAVQLNSLD